MNKVNLTEKFSLFNGLWEPKIVGELNNQYVKLAKLKGEFVWHAHENEDELFMVIKGHLTIKLRDGDIELDGSKPDGTPRKLLDTSRLTSLGWTPSISLEDGIRKTYQWYSAQVS